MSTFDGKIFEVPGISVDNFTNENLQSSIFFLSHYHSDHIYGICDALSKLADDEDTFFCASPITIKIIKEFHNVSKCHTKFKELLPFQSTVMNVATTGEDLRVTSLPAGHSMGSIMLLFETYSTTVLYTGDFRLDAKQLKRMPPLLDGNNYKKIDNIYLDTTFFGEQHKTFPKRTEFVSKVLDEIKHWLDADANNTVCLVTPAYYAYEFIFQDIRTRLGEKVHVPYKLAHIYKYVSELDDVITENRSSARVFVETNRYEQQVRCGERCFKFSAMRWNNANVHTIERSAINENYFFVCYSTHASHEELKEMLHELRPLEVTPCVVPKADQEQFLDDLEELTRSLHEASSSSEEESLSLFKLDQVYDYKTAARGDRFSQSIGSPPR